MVFPARTGGPKDVSLSGICRHKKWFFLKYSCHLFVFFMFLKLISSSKKTWCFSKNVFFVFFSGWFRHLLFLKTLAFKTAKTKTAPFLFPMPLEAMVRRAFESHVVPYLKPPNCRFLATRWLNPWMNLPPKTKMAKWKITIFKRKCIFKWFVFHCYLSFLECHWKGVDQRGTVGELVLT